MSRTGTALRAVAANRGLTAAVAVAFAILLTLGSWQMQRRAWKEALIAQIAARAHAAPMTLEALRSLGNTHEALEYRRVRAQGRYLHEKELHLRGIEDGKPGWFVITPLDTGNGVVLVNRGFVAIGLKNRTARPTGLPAGPVEVTGLVRVPAAERGSFVPENRPAANEWYWLDIPAMQKATQIGGRFLPFVLAAERTASPAPPNGGATRLELPNRHLEYALTWYGLAVTLLVVYATYLINSLKLKRNNIS